MAELWELVDENKKKSGVIQERGKENEIPKGLYHLVVEIWTKNASNKILVTKRHPDKKNGDLWEGTGGSVILGEDSIDGAIRELREETGIIATKNNMYYLGDTFRDNCVVDTYLCVLDEENPKLTLQKEEVVDAKFVTLNELEDMKDEIVSGVYKRFIKYKNKIIN